MREAKGDFYMFVDSDDWIAENCLGLLTEKLRIEKPDVLSICAANVVNGKNVRRQSYLDESQIRGIDLLIKGVSPCAPFSIWSADFFKKNKLKFYEGIFHEDTELTPRAYYLAQKVSLTNELIYYVRQNPNSITRSINPKKSFDIVNIVCPHLADFANEVLPEYRYLFDDMISMHLNCALFDIVDADRKSQIELNEYIYKNKDLINCLSRSRILKYRIEAFLFRLFPRSYVEIYRVLKMK